MKKKSFLWYLVPFGYYKVHPFIESDHSVASAILAASSIIYACTIIAAIFVCSGGAALMQELVK